MFINYFNSSLKPTFKFPLLGITQNENLIDVVQTITNFEYLEELLTNVSSFKWEKFELV